MHLKHARYVQYRITWTTYLIVFFLSFLAPSSSSADPFGGADSGFADFANFDGAGVRHISNIRVNLILHNSN